MSKAGDQRDGDEEARHRRDKGQPAHRVLLFVTPDRQQQAAADDGQKNRKTQHDILVLRLVQSPEQGDLNWGSM